MKKMSITKKILAITIISFIVYTVFGVVIQLLFFERFYSRSKRDSLLKQIESFSEEYASVSDSEQINRALLGYTQDGSYMLIMNEKGDIIHSTSYQLILKNDDGEKTTFFLDHIIRSKQFEELALKEGDKAIVGYMPPHGPMLENGIYMPVEIQTERGSVSFANRAVPRPLRKRDINDGSDIQYANGTVVFVPRADAVRNMINRDDSIRAAMDWMRRVYRGESISDGGAIHYEYTSEETGDAYCVVVKSIQINGGTEMIFAVTTLRPVMEAVGIMQTLQIIWFVIMTVAVIAVSAVLIRKMTRPIMEIASVTTGMKNLDFSRRCRTDSGDEIGMLAENVNSMSDALDKAIRELKEANERLTDDIERERKIEQNRREFTAAVSHELKTPLAIIRAYSEGIIDGVSEKKRGRYLEIIVEETKKMDSLVLDMLENARLEEGAERLDVRRVNLSEIASGAAAVFAGRCEEKGIRLAVSADGGVFAELDAKRIERVITNFISNAVSHTPEGGSVYVSVTEDKEGARCTVENEGGHIAEEELDKIWDRFYKFDKSRSHTKDTGTGLGLSIARNILMLHGAEYFVKNTDRGVMFGFVLKKE